MDIGFRNSEHLQSYDTSKIANFTIKALSVMPIGFPKGYKLFAKFSFCKFFKFSNFESLSMDQNNSPSGGGPPSVDMYEC